MLVFAFELGLCQAFSTFYIDEAGWTVATPSADSRIVYVSSSEGNDSNDGLSPESPKRTIGAADSLIRNGFPDHLLLKRGDTFPSGSLGRWKSGRNADERLVLSYYGDSGPRPVIEVSNILIDHNGAVRDHIAIIGIEIYKPNSDPNSSRFSGASTNSAFRFVGGGANITIEDCKFNYTRMTIQSWYGQGDPEQLYSNFRFRRNIVTDAWTNNSTPLDNNNPNHTSGVYISGVVDYVMEENFFDHNGWSTHSETTLANLFAHNVYIQRDNGPGGIIRGNIVVRGAAHGIQARSGGVVERNFFAQNAIGVNLGGVGIPTYTEEVWAFNNRAVQNVVIEGRNMHPTINSFPRTSAVWGIPLAYVGEVDVIDNIVANRVGDGVNIAIQARTGEPPVSINAINNIVHNWATSHGDVRDTFDPSWLDPSRNLGDYYASIGGTNDSIAFYQTLRNRGLREFPWEYTAYAAISYIREGFNRTGVGGYYEYSGADPVAASGISLNIAARSIGGGENFELIPSVSPADARNQGVSWSSSDESVVRVNDFGIVTGHGPGSATITATTNDGGFTATANVTVQVTPVTSLSVSPTLINRLPVGDSAQLSVTVSPASANQNVVWSSANTNIATVDASGSVTAVSAGTTTITATSVDGNFSASANVITIGSAAPPTQNLAFGASVTASGSSGESVAANLVNGNTLGEPAHRWSAENYPQHAVLDLGESQTIGEFRLYAFEQRAYQYTIEVSNDGSNYNMVVDRTNNTESNEALVDSISAVQARYVRLTITGVTGTYTGQWISIAEFEVYGEADMEVWAGFELLNHRVDTGVQFLGTLRIENEPWVYSEDLNIWIYLTEDNFTSTGAWGYVLGLDDFIQKEDSQWFVALPLRTWLLTTNSSGAQWVYFVQGNK